MTTELDVLVIAQVPLINALVLSNLCEYHHKSYIIYRVSQKNTPLKLFAVCSECSPLVNLCN